VHEGTSLPIAPGRVGFEANISQFEVPAWHTCELEATTLGVGFEEDDLSDNLVECGGKTIGAGSPSLVRRSRFDTDDIVDQSNSIQHARQRPLPRQQRGRQQRRSQSTRPRWWQRQRPRRVCPRQHSSRGRNTD
jgi:hypothetical protein